jgi:polar amino acid transport system substrate-binding protein
MTDRMTRRGLAAAAALAPASFLVSPAHAQGTAQSTFDRVNSTKILRIAVVAGGVPYFRKDISTGVWSGAAIEMAKSIADVWSAQVVTVESTWGNSVLDLQSNKIDIGFGLNPTPQRALSIGFTRPYFVGPYGCISKAGFAPKEWEDLNKPDIRVAVDLGSLHETCARRFTPKAQIIGFKTTDEGLLALQGGRADAQILATSVGLSTVGHNPSLGPYRLLHGPLVALPSAYGIQREPDTRFAEVVNAWIDFNRGIGTVRQQMMDGFAMNGVTPAQIPPDMTF